MLCEIVVGTLVFGLGRPGFPAQEQERLLGKIPDDAKNAYVETWGPGGIAVVYKAWKSSRAYFLLRDGKTEEFENIIWTMFSPDRRTVAYYATKDGETSLVFGDQRVTGVEVYDPRFTPDGKRFSFGAKKGREFWRKGTDGDKLLARIPDDVQGIMEIVWSRDGTSVAYAGAAGSNLKNWHAFVGDKRGERFAEVGSLLLSPDGKTVVYRAKVKKEWVVVVDEKLGERFEEIGILVLSPDGRTPAYSARREGKFLIVIGERPGGDFDQVGDPVFGAKGVAYRASRGGKWFVICRGTKGAGFDRVGDPVFSPDGTRVAYPAMRGEKWVMVVGEKPGEEFDGLWKPRFTPDGKQVIYSAKKGEKISLVVDGKRGEEFDGVTSDEASMNPDGSVVAYPAREGEKMLVVVGKNRSELFDQVGPPELSSDGKKVSFGARKGRELWWKVMEVR